LQHFTKTGSGQTWGKLKKEWRFLSELPVQVVSHLDVRETDVVCWDDQTYPVLRNFLRDIAGIRHVIMMGYAADMCLISTTAGYENVSQDFNCFVVGDATLATFPANDSPAYATVRHSIDTMAITRAHLC
jgi:nicotinamidase-related amidase